MKRLAIFVEGYTELLFVSKLLNELAGQDNIVIEKQQIRGGATVAKTVAILEAVKPSTDEQYYVLIVDCGGDHNVKPRLQEEYVKLSEKGYEKIIGILDVRPNFLLEEIPRLRQGLKFGIKTANVAPVCFILATMELETWLLAEFSHYQKIRSHLTAEFVTEKLGFDPRVGDLSDRTHPADDLNSVYALGGREYKKGNSHTIDLIDMTEIYLNVSARIKDLNELKDCLDSFFTVEV